VSSTRGDATAKKPVVQPAATENEKKKENQISMTRKTLLNKKKKGRLDLPGSEPNTPIRTKTIPTKKAKDRDRSANGKKKKPKYESRRSGRDLRGRPPHRKKGGTHERKVPPKVVREQERGTRNYVRIEKPGKASRGEKRGAEKMFAPAKHFTATGGPLKSLKRRKGKNSGRSTQGGTQTERLRRQQRSSPGNQKDAAKA